MMKKFYTLLLLCAGLVVIASSASAERTATGFISFLKDNTMVLITQSKIQDHIFNIYLQINDDTKFHKFSTVDQLGKGDLVEVSYKIHQGLKVATDVTKIAEEEYQLSYSDFIERLNQNPQ